LKFTEAQLDLLLNIGDALHGAYLGLVYTGLIHGYPHAINLMHEDENTLNNLHEAIERVKKERHLRTQLKKEKQNVKNRSTREGDAEETPFV